MLLFVAALPSRWCRGTGLVVDGGLRSEMIRTLAFRLHFRFANPAHTAKYGADEINGALVTELHAEPALKIARRPNSGLPS